MEAEIRGGIAGGTFMAGYAVREMGKRNSIALRICSLGVYPMWMLAACAAEPMFPSSVERTVDPDKQIGIFNSEADTYLKGEVVLLGGRIVSAKPKEGGFVVVAQELPVQERPSRRPIDNVKSTGDFVFFYQGTVEPSSLLDSNKFLLVGVMRGNETVVIGGAVKMVPYVVARCLHIWKTGRYAIADFPDLPDGFFPLAEETYCLPKTP